MAAHWPLKLKYRNPNKKLLRRSGVDPAEGTWTFAAGKFGAKPRTNSGKKQGLSIRPRRRSYGPW